MCERQQHFDVSLHPSLPLSLKINKYKSFLKKNRREKQLVSYRRVPIRLSADFSKETLQARRDWQEIFKVMKSRGL